MPRQLADAAPYEAAAAADPRSIVRHIELAHCYDTAWRFTDAARTVVSVLALLRDEMSRAEKPAPVAEAPVALGGDVPFPDKTRDGPVEYPENAAARGIQGVVVVETTVDRQGRVRRTQVAESIGGLDKAAVDAVRRWQFAPTLVGGRAVEGVMYFFVRFGLPRELMPADWLDMAKFYYRRGLLQQAITPLEAAVARERRDFERFGDAGHAMELGPNRLVQEPAKIRHANPVYPPPAVDLRAEGTVIIEAMIDRFGDVGRARVTRSVPLFDAAAIDGVMQWGYTPVRVDGKAVSVYLIVTVNFRLR